VQPDKILVGTVYTGATVEASFMVFEPGKNANIRLEVTAPPFVKILNKETEVKQFGMGNHFVCGSVEMAFDTAAVGEWTGDLKVTLGQTTAKLPVSVTVKPRRPGLTRLLIAESPFNRYSASDGALFKAWTDLIRKPPMDVSYLLVTSGKPVLRDLDLTKFDSVLLAGTGLVSLTPADVQKARQFAEKGGWVVVAANRFYRGTVDQANLVVAKYGLQMRDEEAPFGQNAATLGKEDLDQKIVNAGVKSLSFFRASPVAVTDSKTGRVLVKAVGTGQEGDGFVARAKAGHGTVVALGVSLWWDWISDKRAADTDNAKLLRWLLLPQNLSEL